MEVVEVEELEEEQDEDVDEEGRLRGSSGGDLGRGGEEGRRSDAGGRG